MELYKIQKAIKFAVKTHEIYQKQKRKGKNVAYITHPLTAGILLSHIGADVDVVCAGILHDTIEDSINEKKVTVAMLNERFGEHVAGLVDAVTETDRGLSWVERKRLAKEHIVNFSHDALLVKSADIISNGQELVDDHERNGDSVFHRFNASKEDILKNQLELIALILQAWPETPFAKELSFLSSQFHSIGGSEFLSKNPAKIIRSKDFNKNDKIVCPVCGWKGTSEDNIEYYEDPVADVCCPICGDMILVIDYSVSDK
jgi:hypothetical protein